MTIVNPVPPIGSYVPPFMPLDNITPFTYRDGMTYLQILHELKRYINLTLVPFVDTEFTSLGTEFATQVSLLLDTVNANIATLTTNVDDAIATEQTYVDTTIAAEKDYVDAQIAAIINSTITVTDPVTLAIFNSLTSSTRVAMDAVYESKTGLALDVLNVESTARSVIYPAGSATGAVTFDTLQTALTAAEAAGKKVVAAGTINDTRTLVITSDADLSQLTYNYTGTGIAVRIGKLTANVNRLYVSAPKIINTTKVGNGWAAVVNTIGLDICNAFTCTVVVPHINNFETGLRMYAASFGNSYNQVYIGSLNNNMINLQNFADTGGYVNQNTYMGGRFSHNSSEGADVVGTKHIHLKHLNSVNADPNNNVFINPSIESPGVVEYAVDIAGSLNLFLNARFENSASHQRVYWRSTAYRNMFIGGFNLDSILESSDAGGYANSFWGPQRMMYRALGTNGGILIQNGTSDTAPDLTVFAAAAALTANAQTDYMAQLRTNVFGLKKAASTNDLVKLDGAGAAGRLYLSDGVAAPVVGLTGGATTLRVNTGTTEFGAVTDNQVDLGGGTTRFANGRFGGFVRIGAFTTATRPAAPGQGAMIFDTTLNKPVWYTGSVWVDATGATV